jgi:hypothetical protein
MLLDLTEMNYLAKRARRVKGWPDLACCFVAVVTKLS